MGFLNEVLKETDQKAKIQPEKYAEFIDLFRTWSKGLAWNNKMLSQGYRIDDKLPSFKRIENKVDILWARMNEEEQKECQIILCRDGDIPEHICRTLKSFDGLIVSITGEN